MKYLTITLSLLASMAIAAPTTPETAKTFVPMTWTGKVFLDGNNVTLTGNGVEDIHAQVLKINPNFDIHVAPENIRIAEALRKNQTLQARDGSQYCTNRRCGPSDIGGYCDIGWIIVGVSYLSHLGGSVNLPAGIAQCSRISCSYNSAIYLCNDDNYHSLNLPLTFAGNMASDLYDNSCKQPGNSNNIRGHCFRGPFGDGNSDSYNVWVRGDRC